MSSHSIGAITEEGLEGEFGGAENYKLKDRYAPLDLIGEISENTGLCHGTAIAILKGANHENLIRNPPRFICEASALIKNIQLDEMIRGVSYHLTGENFPFDFNDFVKQVDESQYIDTPNRGFYDRMLTDSEIERSFAHGTDSDDEIVCFMKLPAYYKIPTPIGHYSPDFGIVMKRKSLKDGKQSEFYFVIETKGTNDIHDKKALKRKRGLQDQVHHEAFRRFGGRSTLQGPGERLRAF